MPVDFIEPSIDLAAPLRQAAMLLHSMAEPDRRWMLARVDAAQRTRLQALLDELAALEFPVDPGLIREALAGMADSAESLPQASGVASWTVDQATSVLRDERADVVALLLRAGDWPWAEGLRVRVGVARLRAIEESRYASGPLPPATFLRALIDAARARHDSLAEATARSVP